MNVDQSYQEAKATSTTHGLITLKRAIKTLGSRVIDRRTSLGKQLNAWRSELIESLGGNDAVSVQERAIVDAAVTTKLMLDSLDAWVLSQPSLVNHRKRAVWPVVGQRQALSDALVRYMMQLGLSKRSRPTMTLAELLQRSSPSPAPSPSPSPEAKGGHPVDPS